MQDFINKKIVLGVCGGIAAYKAALLVRELVQLGAVVRVVMTQSAQEFISPLTFQALSGHEVRTSLFDSQAEKAMGHIELARWADYLVVAPASANLIAKLAHGLADDLLTTLYLATEAPVLLCPAMNQKMWLHPATQSNCKLLQSRGVTLIGPEDGVQACGEEGFGRLSEVLSILSALRLHGVPPVLVGRRVLITAGPTREPIDPVRYLTNRSSGKMGYALAEAAKHAGAEVILISGPTALSPPPGVIFYSVETAQAMFDAVMLHVQPDMIFISAAAVADYRAAHVMVSKLKKGNDSELNLSLVQNPDIVASVAQGKKAAFVVGFAAETQDVLVHAANKLHTKQLDLIIANEVGEGVAFDADDNQVTVLTKQHTVTLPKAHKTRLAGQLIAQIAEEFAQHTKG